MSLYKVRHTGSALSREQESTKLNYQMIFEDHDTDSESRISEKYEKEIRDILQKKEAEWAVKLKRESETSYLKGVEQGRKEGRQEALTEMNSRFSFLECMISEAHREFSERQESLTPGLLDTVFFLSEKILELPVENPDIRKRMERELEELIHKADQTARPSLLVSQSDFEFVKELVEKQQPELKFQIRPSKECNPGEFVFETERGKIVQQFRQILRDFRERLNIPSWK
ncbi:MAG: hypothetical protein EA360_06530 [Balneolaceae bacterium]|nr:MAG: hypothetical protein EA360_06530 [Balneolaceae bacterium]